MLAVKGIYVGDKVELLERIPFKGRRNVIVTFLDEISEQMDAEQGIDPIEALRGCARGSNLTEKLLESRGEDVELEEAKWSR